jgi:hypothetical protein
MEDLDNIERNSFNFLGNYRGIVENTADPLRAGRIQVRIIGLHSPDPLVTPTKDLPWAYPALSLYHSGGNLVSPGKQLNETVNPESRYNPKNGAQSPNANSGGAPSQNTTNLSVTPWFDSIESECGAAAFYTTPRKGSIVWLFFEDGGHSRPHYFAAATKNADFTSQFNKLSQVINLRQTEVTELKAKIKPDVTEYIGKGTVTKKAKVATKIPAPKANIHTIDNLLPENISSITSTNGTTIVTTNDNGKERIYIIHKGSTQYIDEFGQHKTIIGSTKGQNNKTVANDSQILGANNIEVHLIGDYNLYTNGNIFLEAEKNVEINAKQHVGIVVRSGDVDVIVNKGDCNIDVNGNANLHAQNIQAEAAKDITAKAGGNITVTNTGNTVINSGSIQVNNAKDLNLVSSGGNINLQTPGNINLVGKDVKVTATNHFQTIGPKTDINSADLSLTSAKIQETSTTHAVVSTNLGLAGASVNIKGQLNLGATAVSPVVTSSPVVPNDPIVPVTNPPTVVAPSTAVKTIIANPPQVTNP